MTEAILYAFTGLDGSTSASSLLLGGNGVLYGATELGGASGDGMVAFGLAPTATPGDSWNERGPCITSPVERTAGGRTDSPLGPHGRLFWHDRECRRVGSWDGVRADAVIQQAISNPQ